MDAMVQFSTTKMALDHIPVINDPRTNGRTGKLEAPTDDDSVRTELRKLGEPITYFGEGKADRRDRLLRLLGEQPHTSFGFADVAESDQDESMEEEDDDEDFYTPGTEELLQARKQILTYSVQKAIDRTEKQKKDAGVDFAKILKNRRHINHHLTKFELDGTYTLRGNTRALSAVRINKDNLKIACGSWDGNFYVMERENSNLSQVARLEPRNHTEKVGALDWSPVDAKILVTGGAEGKLNFWLVDGPVLKPTTTKIAHSGRICKAAFHPSGAFVASTSFDQTWKLWDVNRDEALLEQEGHSKEVFACSFHPDGSLLATGGLDAVGRVWDLRSGRSIATLESHVQGIYSMDWSPNGYHLASASGDCSVKIWDMRKNASEVFSIPAHTKLVSEVRVFTGRLGGALAAPVADENDQYPEKLDVSGTYLASSSYDGTVKIWSADNWVAVKTLKGHTDKVMSCDIALDGLYVVSCGWDRALRMWGTI